MSIQINKYNIFDSELESILAKKEKVVINTINSYSYIVAKKDITFREALLQSDILLPDGEGIVMMAKKLKGKKINKIAGADLHEFLLKHSNANKLKCFYLGASNSTLDIIKSKASKQFPNIVFDSFSPPFKDVFTDDDNEQMISRINNFSPEVLFIGMTAPKQEKWITAHREKINFKFAGSIGAVFDFYAETKSRAPQWVINIKMEWLHRALSSWRLAKRYLYSNPLFLMEVLKLKINNKA